MASQKEKNNKVIAAASTLGMYAVLFLILLFTVAWRTPYPPLPGGEGVSLILGTDDFGSGAVPDEPIGTTEPEQQKEELKQDEPKEEVKQQPDVQQEEDKEVVTSTEESPVTAKKEDPKKKEEKKEVVKPVEPKKEEPKKEEPKKEETPKAVYDPNKNKGSSDNKTGTPGSKGDDEGKAGDKGDPRGTPTGAVYKGNPGSGGDGKGGSGGPSLDMAGWAWVEMPETPKTSEEDKYSGQVTFKFEVNELGEVGKIEKLSGNLTYALEQKCREALRKTVFYKESSGEAPPSTPGRITFTLRVQ